MKILISEKQLELLILEQDLNITPFTTQKDATRVSKTNLNPKPIVKSDQYKTIADILLDISSFDLGSVIEFTPEEITKLKSLKESLNKKSFNLNEQLSVVKTVFADSRIVASDLRSVEMARNILKSSPLMKQLDDYFKIAKDTKNPQKMLSYMSQIKKHLANDRAYSNLMNAFAKEKGYDNFTLLRNDIGVGEHIAKTIAQKNEESKEIFLIAVKRAKQKIVGKYGQNFYDHILNQLFKKNITKEEFLNFLTFEGQLVKPKFEVYQGIKFYEDESKEINSIGNLIFDQINYNAIDLNKTNFAFKFYDVKGNSKYGLVKLVTYDDIEKLFPNDLKRMENYKNSAPGWANLPSSTVYINVELLQKLYYAENIKKQIKTILVHEIAHLKDPSFVSSKLNKKYDPGALGDEEWYKKYYHHFFEVNAIRAQILEHMSNQVKTLAKKYNKKIVLNSLDNIISYFSNSGGIKLSEVSFEIIGFTGKNSKEDFNHFFHSLSQREPEKYKKFIDQIVKHCLYLKDQVKFL